MRTDPVPTRDTPEVLAEGLDTVAGWAVHTTPPPGRRVAFAEGHVRNGAGRVVATATSSVLIVPVQPQDGGTAGRAEATSGQEIR